MKALLSSGHAAIEDFARDLEERIPQAVTKEEFFAQARIMSHYLDPKKKYTEDQTERAWWWRELIR